jgi:hypothetical protein
MPWPMLRAPICSAFIKRPRILSKQRRGGSVIQPRDHPARQLPASGAGSSHACSLHHNRRTAEYPEPGRCLTSPAAPSQRRIVKDLASLCFSSLNLSQTCRNVLRFVRVCRGASLPQVPNEGARFWGRFSGGPFVPVGGISAGPRSCPLPAPRIERGIPEFFSRHSGL